MDNSASDGTAERSSGSWYGNRAVALVFISIVAGLSAWSAPSLLRFKAPPVDIVDGSMTRAFEKHFDESFPLRTASINFWTAAQLVLFGEGRLGVVIGTDGWLYTNEEFDVRPDWAAALEENLHFIGWSLDRLKAEGVPVVVAIVPEKARIYSEHIGRARAAQIHASVGARLAARLQERQVPVIVLEQTLRAGKDVEATYLRTDTHWTPFGAERAAAEVVASIRQLGLASSHAEADAFTIERGPEVPHHGDLLSFLPLEPMFPSLMPPPETLKSVKTVARAAAADSADLLAEAPVPDVALIGTSYSANPKWNFAGFIEAGLSEPVANYAKDGNGPLVPMASYLTGEDLKTHRPRVLVWEIPERALTAHAQLATFHLPIEATQPRPAAVREP